MDNLPSLLNTLTDSRTDRLPIAVFMLDTENPVAKQVILAAIEELGVNVSVSIDGTEDVAVGSDKGKAKLKVLILTGGEFILAKNENRTGLFFVDHRYAYTKDSINNWESGVPHMYDDLSTGRRLNFGRLHFITDLLIWGKYFAGDRLLNPRAVFYVACSRTTASGLDFKINLPPEGV